MELEGENSKLKAETTATSGSVDAGSEVDVSLLQLRVQALERENAELQIIVQLLDEP